MTYPQALHLLGLAKNLSLEKFEVLNQSGLLSDIFSCEDPSHVDRYSLRRVLDGEHIKPTFPVFLECEVGGKSKDKFITELEANGMFVSDWAKDIMSKPAWTTGEKEIVRFGRATLKELDFTHEPTLPEILARIEVLGHAKCESQDGPAIRLALKDQSKNDWFWCVMETIADSDGYPDVFDVERFVDGGRWLRTFWIEPTSRLGLGDPVVFRLRK